jgi:hypothetical protein
MSQSVLAATGVVNGSRVKVIGEPPVELLHEERHESRLWAQ